MLVGTLSTERDDDQQSLSGLKRRDCVADVVCRFKPDLLVCAGDALASYADLAALSNDERIKHSSTTIVIEVSNENKGHKGSKKGSNEKGEGGFKSDIYLLNGKKITRLGRQVFGDSSEVRGNGTSATSVRTKFENELANRVFKIKGKSALVLCCGEINILQSSDEVLCESAVCEGALRRADIIVNPTHDRMGHPATLLAKRIFLSRRVDGRKRLYVSSSNWNTEKDQRRTAPTLHDYFLSGERLKINEHVERCSKDKIYEYRQAEIEL